MIDKSHLRDTMRALTEAELLQTRQSYQRFLVAAQIDRSEPVGSDKQGQAETAADLAEAFDDREHEVQAKIAMLHALDFGPKTSVQPGAAVRFGDRFLVVGVSTNEFECQGYRFVGISSAAPIYQALEGAVAGEVGDFRGRKITIQEIF